MKCPKCGSVNINQYRMMTGKIWCNDCGFEALEKEKYNPFVQQVTISKKMYQEFENKEEIINFALGVMCMDLKTEIEGLSEDDRSDYNVKLCKMSVDELCKEADWLYYLSGK